MCFRPAEISSKGVCPDCGKKINPVANVFPKKCPFCGGEGPFEVQEAGGTAPTVVAPSAPAAPQAPQAPAAPGAPAEN